MKTFPPFVVAALLCAPAAGHADAPAGRYTATAATVRDNLTGLVWQRGVNASQLTWKDAVTHCEGLVLDGSSAWRLPTIKELQTLVDETRKLPAYDPVFTEPQGYTYDLSSTPSRDSTTMVWALSTGGGNPVTVPSTLLAWVRCVR